MSDIHDPPDPPTTSLDPPRDYTQPGVFKPGYRPPSRRAPGVRNKITRDLKQGIIAGAVKHGSHGNGKGGLNGYLAMAAKKYPRDYLKLLGKLLPYCITADKSIGTIGAINIVAAPSDMFLSPEKIREIRGLPPLAIESKPPFEEPIEQPEATAIETEPEPEMGIAFGNVRRLDPFNRKDRK